MSDNTPAGDQNPPVIPPAPAAAATPESSPYGGTPAAAYDAPAAATAPPYAQTAPSAYPGAAAQPAYPAAPAYGQGQAYGAPAPTNTLAIVALIGGIAGLTILPFIGSLVGIITGHMALSRLKTSGEQGRGMALAGVITGYVGVAFCVLGILMFFALFIPLMASVPTY